MRIGIAGAGIGGLAAAALLARDGHEVTILDRFDRPRPVGSGLVIQPVGQAVLDLVGAGEAALRKGARITGLRGVEARTGRPVLDVAYDRTGSGRYGLAIHRASLFAALLDATCRWPVRLLTSAEVTGRTEQFLVTTEGRHGPFDLIVDAAGASSPLSPLRARVLPYGAIWGTVAWPQTPLPRDRLSQVYRRADPMIGILPLGTLPGDATPRAAVFWSLPEAGHAGWRARGLGAWRAEATALWPEVAPFLDQITAADQMTMARYTHGTLRHPWSEAFVHIGDAAHRASPQLGQGANMALLDAYALVRAVALHPLSEAPRAYALARRWHVRAYQAMSAAFTPQYQSDSRVLPVLRDHLLYPLSHVPPVPRILTALVAGDLLPPLGSLTPRPRVPARTARTGR